MSGSDLATWLWEDVFYFWPHMVAALTFCVSLVVSGHAVLYKSDTRAAIAWVGVIWLAPLLGSVLYLWLGINRIHRRARHLRGPSSGGPAPLTHACPEASLEQEFGAEGQHLCELVRAVGRLTNRPLLKGNHIEPLVGPAEAYPAMLEAIAAAERSITLSTYIFNNDPTGQRFVAALAKARERGVEVRVLIDAIGARYAWPPITGSLRSANIPVATFLPALVPVWFPYANLRNHRKICVVNGQVGFTGGMNIRQSAPGGPKRMPALQDLHFRFHGPVVTQLQQVFADDWQFSTHEALAGDKWFPALEGHGGVLARGISDGPDEDIDHLRLTLLAAIACARTSIQIVTPYFLPDAALITSLNVASMRGVEVNIVLPSQNNLTLVQWASTAQLWQMLRYDCRVWLTEPLFDHTKLMLVDNAWSLVGSGNWDPRSLRLNFEFNVECYDRELAKKLGKVVSDKLAKSRQVRQENVNGRKLPIKLRDGIARLFSPYL